MIRNSSSSWCAPLWIVYQEYESREQLPTVCIQCGGTSIGCFSGSSAVHKDGPSPHCCLLSDWMAHQIRFDNYIERPAAGLAEGPLERLGCRLGCNPFDPDPQLCLENSDLQWICPCHATLSALRDSPHSRLLPPLGFSIHFYFFPPDPCKLECTLQI